MRRCPTCGAEYPDEARFCSRDGARLVERMARAAPGPASTDELPGQLLESRYRVERRVGEGGMSTVYLASDLATGAPVAVKVLSAALSRDAKAMARLRREAEVGMRLTHPHVCRILHVGETVGGQVFVVMPFLNGELLCDLLARQGPLPMELVLPIVADVGAGLDAAHALGIVHRDLKPENVMITREPDGRQRAVIMDFGLAKERRLEGEAQRLTATGIVLGTPEFMSPEQLRGQPLDGRSDLYALALMTCELLTGELPFRGRTQQEQMLARLRGDPIPLGQLRPELAFPSAVERVIATALARSPAGRFASAPQFVEALRAAATASPAPRASGAQELLSRLFGR